MAANRNQAGGMHAPLDLQDEFHQTRKLWLHALGCRTRLWVSLANAGLKEQRQSETSLLACPGGFAGKDAPLRTTKPASFAGRLPNWTQPGQR